MTSYELRDENLFPAHAGIDPSFPAYTNQLQSKAKWTTSEYSEVVHCEKQKKFNGQKYTDSAGVVEELISYEGEPDEFINTEAMFVSMAGDSGIENLADETSVSDSGISLFIFICAIGIAAISSACIVIYVEYRRANTVINIEKPEEESFGSLLFFRHRLWRRPARQKNRPCVSYIYLI